MVNIASSAAVETEFPTQELSDGERLRIENRLSGLSTSEKKQSFVVDTVTQEQREFLRQFIVPEDTISELTAWNVIIRNMRDLSQQEGQ